MSKPYYIFYRFFVKPVLTLYLRTDRTVSYAGFKLLVKKGVFHPLLFFSTKIFYEFIEGLDLAGRSFLEIGSGSGLLSLLAKRKGALVTAVDIDANAVESTGLNFMKNFGKGHTAVILQSDVFSNIPERVFNVIVINPPYYFKDPGHAAERAWFCGKEGEYFEKLFVGLGKYTDRESEVYMILEEKCDLERIKAIAEKHGLEFVLEKSKKVKWERSFIFRLNRK